MRLALLLLLAARGDVDAATPVDRATLVAEALLAADQATPDRAGRDRRSAALRTIDRIGATPADGVEDPRPRWRRAGGTPAEPMRGRLLGPAFRHGAIPPGGTWRVDQTFLAGRTATVSLASQPRAATSLSIATAAGVRCTGTTRCRWVPRFTERYTIVVNNMAGAPARFFLVTD